MSRPRAVIGARPASTTVTAWVRRGHGKATAYAARLTIDVTPALRGRNKMAAFRRGVTAAAMLRAVLEHEFPDQTP